MLKEIKRGILFTIVSMALFGGAYHAILWAVGRAFFPQQAEGSLIRRQDGTIVGSHLIAQSFTRDDFHPRPSAVDYNAASTGGSNYGPSNPEYLELVRQRTAEVAAREGVAPDLVPSEMVTASGGGLDPHISLLAADFQAPRVAGSRGVPVDRIRALIRTSTEAPAFGWFGAARVNVLELNLALDGLRD